MLKGFAQAQAEYEAKMNNPYEDETQENYEDYEFMTDVVEEMMLRDFEDYLRG